MTAQKGEQKQYSQKQQNNKYKLPATGKRLWSKFIGRLEITIVFKTRGQKDMIYFIKHH